MDLSFVVFISLWLLIRSFTKVLLQVVPQSSYHRIDHRDLSNLYPPKPCDVIDYTKIYLWGSENCGFVVLCFLTLTEMNSIDKGLYAMRAAIFTGSRGDVFVRKSKPVENLWKNGLFWSRYTLVTHSIDRKRASVVLRRGYGLRLLIFKMANNQGRSGSAKKSFIVDS